jgi:oligopeptidase B
LLSQNNENRDAHPELGFTPKVIRIGQWWYPISEFSDPDRFTFCRFPASERDKWLIGASAKYVKLIERGRDSFSIKIENNLRFQSFEVGLSGKIGVLTLRPPTSNYCILKIIDLSSGSILLSIERCGIRSVISRDDSHVYFTVVNHSGSICQIRKQRIDGDQSNSRVMNIDPNDWATIHPTETRGYFFVSSRGNCQIIRLETDEFSQRIFRGCEQLRGLKSFEQIATPRDGFVGFGYDSYGQTGIISIGSENLITQSYRWTWHPVAFGTIQNLIVANEKIVIQTSTEDKSELWMIGYQSMAQEKTDTNWELVYTSRNHHYTNISLSRPADPKSKVIFFQVECPVCRPVTVHFSTQDSMPSLRADETVKQTVIEQNLKHTVRFLKIRSDDDQCDIPVTLISPVANRQLTDRPRVALLVYGCYGASLPLIYDPMTAQLVEHGICVAYAHVRGGGEKGKDWHLAAIGRKKNKTISDYLTVAKNIGLLLEGKRIRITAVGASAGGTIVAAALNKEPQLFSAAFLAAPFVSPIRSTQDETNPRKKVDIHEFGDPDNGKDFEIMQEWSPLENVASQHYPPILVAINECDDNVSNHDILEYVERLKKTSTDVRTIVRKNATHSSDCSDFAGIAELNWIYAH